MNKKKSELITAGMREGFREGTSKLANRMCYGYEYDERGELVVFVPETRVVLKIFTMYNMGNSLGEIVDYLAACGVPSPIGKPRWNRQSLGKLLRNEKYIGCVRLQKTIVQDGKQVANHAVDQYLYTNDGLREMHETNGFILQNCVGDPQEWVDAINETLTENGVLQNGEAFINVPMLTHNGATNLLFFMDGLSVGTADITAWVQETRGTVEGMMLNDYREKMFGISTQTSEQRSKPECPIIGADGNIFNLVGIASRTLKRAGQHDAEKEM